MIPTIFFIIFCLFSCILAVQVTTIPFLLGCLLVLFITYRTREYFFLALILGVLFDIMTLHPVGQTSLVLLLILFLVSLYERKFEIRTYPFIFFASFFGSALFLVVQHEPYVLQQSGIVALFTLWSYQVIRSSTLYPGATL